MTEIFKFKNQQVRFVGDTYDPCWVAPDICGVLNISNNRNCLDGLEQDELIETYSSFDLLAIAIEKSCDGEMKEADKIFEFVGASIHNGFISPSLERIYFACRIFHAWSRQQENKIEVDKAKVVYLVGCQENQSMKIGTTSNTKSDLKTPFLINHYSTNDN